VSAVIAPGPAHRRPVRVGRNRLAATAVLLALAAVVFGLRLAARPPSPVSQPPLPHTTPMPASPAIEAAWGIRFSALILGADRGMLDVRYQVVDPAKSGRIHGGSTNNPDPQAAVKNLPSFIRESDGQRILPGSAMMHFEHFHFQTEALGNTYSILYGNSGGLLHVGDKVTIVMTDGLRLAHVTVSS